MHLWGVALCFAAFGALGQERTLPITVGDDRGAAGHLGPLVEVQLRLDVSGIDRVEVVRLTRSLGDKAWRLAEIARAPADRLIVRAPAGVESLLLLRASSRPGYLLDGPFRWPAQPSTYVIAPRWRRTIRGRQPRDGAGSITWVPGREDDRRDAWPACAWLDDESWECVGVPLSVPGVVLSAPRGLVHYSVAAGALTRPGIEDVSVADALWGRLLIVNVAQPEAARRLAGVHASALRLSVPRARPQSARLEATTDATVRVTRVGTGAFWLSGAATPVDGWVELGGSGFAPLRIETTDVAGSPPELPMRVALESPVEVTGRVTGGPDVPAVGALVTLYRFAHDPPIPKRPPRRIVVSEQRASDDGAFRFGDLAMERYEIVAMHPVLGRGERRFDPDGQEVEIALRKPPEAIGRVTRDGVPVRGVPVTVVPDLAQFAAADDMTELRGGDATTDQDGRFAVLLASRGRGEIRIGQEATGVRRIPLGSAETLPPIIDVGTIELDALAPVTLVLEGSDGCQLLLVGPSGRTGMTIVRAVRLGPAMFQASLPEPGRWMVSAVCGKRERAVIPAAIDLPAGARDRTIRLAWPLQMP